MSTLPPSPLIPTQRQGSHPQTHRSVPILMSSEKDLFRVKLSGIQARDGLDWTFWSIHVPVANQRRNPKEERSLTRSLPTPSCLKVVATLRLGTTAPVKGSGSDPT